MVALKTGRLHDRDIWPDIIWSDKQWHAKRDEFEAQLRAQGIKDHYLFFAISRAMEAHQSQFPKLRERQEAMRRIYPFPKAPRQLVFTDDELRYISDRLAGANDELGQGIARKIAELFSSRGC